MIAVFDLDHTLISANSSFCFGAFLFKQKKITFAAMVILVLIYCLHKSGCLSIERVHYFALKFIFAGKSQTEVQALAESFLDNELQKMVRPNIMERFSSLKSQNFTTVLASSSPSFLVDSIAKRLGFDQSQSSQYLVDKEGKFVRILNLVNGEEKKKYLESILSHKDRFTIAFSDSFLDLPLLQKVDKPICVSPDRKLRQFAERYRWEVIEDGSSI